ncbi:MAG TPA: LacI family DNA-binding transcriptional regulator, partial [Rariglobus sp.]
HNHPSIPAATRDRVRKIAEKLGYAPDPMMSALVSYRQTLNPASYQGTIAWLVNNAHPFDWSRVAMFKEYHQGAVGRAAKHGYKLEVFDLQSAGTTPEKLAKAFRFRKINGVLVCPQPGPNWRLDFPWEHFSCVTFGYSLVHPQLHTVAPTQFRAMLETMRRLTQLGYSRIGFAYSFNTDERADHNFLGGYLVESYLNDHQVHIPPFNEETATADNFSKWFETHRPEAVVTGNPRLLRIIKAAGLFVPRDIGVACPTVPGMESSLAGIYENSRHIGETAVDTLVSMIHQGDRGVPETPHYIHVPGVWIPGKTLRASRHIA